MTEKTIQHVVMHISEFTIDRDWNMRSDRRTRIDGAHRDGAASEDADAGNLGLSGLAMSMAEVGQNTEVDVCILPASKGGKPFLATGFRRTAAVEKMLAEDPPLAIKGLEPGQIRVCLRDGLSMAEIRALNIGENVKEGIVTADHVFAINDLFAQDPDLKQKEVAAMLNMGEDYISQLRTIGKASPKILKAWRDTTDRPLGKNRMVAIAKLPTEKEQIAAYEEETKKTKVAPGDKTGKEWEDGARQRAYDLGFTLGSLARLGKLTLGTKNDPFDVENIDGQESFLDAELAAQFCGFKATTTVITGGEKSTAKVSVSVHRKLAKAVNEGIAAGYAEPETEEGEETPDTETAEKTIEKAASKKAGKKAKKASASEATANSAS